jgi:peptide chain release factor 1
MFNIYLKVIQKNNFVCTYINKRFGYVSIWLTEKQAYDFFINEVGGHRWQRIPPTEHKGRVHTSIVIVSLVEKDENLINLNKREVEIIHTKGTGPGGQHRNKVESCVELRHTPTGISVRIDGRSKIQNEKIAWFELEKRLKDLNIKNNKNKLASIKREQIGISNRSNKIRTYNEKTGVVINHLNDKKITFRELYKGNIEKLY